MRIMGYLREASDAFEVLCIDKVFKVKLFALSVVWLHLYGHILTSVKISATKLPSNFLQRQKDGLFYLPANLIELHYIKKWM